LNPQAHTAIAVFARAPIAGEVKTRLIPRLGAEGAASLQKALTERALRTALAAGVGRVSLWCWPDENHPAFAVYAKDLDVSLFPQRGADLGARMLAAFEELCGGGPAIVVGTDCPALTPRELRSASEGLAHGYDAVVIPAADGGYVLLGLRRPEASLFVAMPWGSSDVMAESRSRLQQARLRWLELPCFWDVDRPEDLDRLEASGLMSDSLPSPR
jgi:rSAM/selenodomain-associated transferase 1